MAGSRLNSFRITVILVVFIILCYVDWSPSSKQRAKRSPVINISTIVYDSCQNNGEIGVTFDEGPVVTTRMILDILKANKIKATFHLIPSKIKENLEFAKAIIDEGHLIGLHVDPSLTEKQLKSLSVDKIKEELENEANIIYKALGVNPKFLRLPYNLDKNANYLTAVQELGFVLTDYAVDLSGAGNESQLTEIYESTLKQHYNKDMKEYPKFIDRNQDGLANIPEVWKRIVAILESYNAKVVTLDVCTGVKEKYRPANGKKI